jgi:serine/threonine protein kinase
LNEECLTFFLFSFTKLPFEKRDLEGNSNKSTFKLAITVDDIRADADGLVCLVCKPPQKVYIHPVSNRKDGEKNREIHTLHMESFFRHMPIDSHYYGLIASDRGSIDVAQHHKQYRWQYDEEFKKIFNNVFAEMNKLVLKLENHQLDGKTKYCNLFLYIYKEYGFKKGNNLLSNVRKSEPAIPSNNEIILKQLQHINDTNVGKQFVCLNILDTIRLFHQRAGDAHHLLFQLAYTVYNAKEQFSTGMVHYDISPLIVLVDVNTSNDCVLSYGLKHRNESFTFALRTSRGSLHIAKVIDFGTSRVGQNVSDLQFTILENIPPEYFLCGNMAKQGYSNECFAIGLSMLHLFTGQLYQEILASVVCPSYLKTMLSIIYASEQDDSFSVIRSVIQKNSNNETLLLNTIYRYLILFGRPKKYIQPIIHPRVWKAILFSFNRNDSTQYKLDCEQYSFLTGKNITIRRARNALSENDGLQNLFLGLCNFNPLQRKTAFNILMSNFMTNLRERKNERYDESVVEVHSYNCNDK